MKLIAVCPRLSLSEHYGTAPVWWQLFKALYELGVDTLVIPLLGSSIESVWWRSCKGPFFTWDSINRLPLIRRSQLMIAKSFRKIWWKWFLRKIEGEEQIDAILWISVPIHVLKGFPTYIERTTGVRCIYFDADAPCSLPEYDRYSQYKNDYDLSEFDALVIPSKGAVKRFEEMGANRVYVVYFAVDPMLYSPLKVSQDIDVFFYGRNDLGREDQVKNMLSYPQEKMTGKIFAIGGGGAYSTPLNHLRSFGEIPFSIFRRFCCRSKINLNIARKAFAETYASSISRPFELASLECCIVSNPCNGISEWFEIGKEIFVVHNAEEALEMYEWLLSSEEERLQAGKMARERVLRKHTYTHRAKELISILRK